MKGALASAALLVAACGPDENAPILTRLRCADPHRCQSIANPFLLELMVDFSDPDGDFGAVGGMIDLLVDDKVQATRPAADYFASTGVDPRSIQGSLRFDLEVSFRSIQDGTQFVVAVAAKDARGHESNQPTLTMELNIE